MRFDKESESEEKKESAEIQWPLEEDLMSIEDFNTFKIESISWNVESAFKRDCGGFKLHFKNGYESHWCQIHKQSENVQRKHFG